MAITKDDVVEYLKGMTLLEASELVKELEEVFGVSAAALGPEPAARLAAMVPSPRRYGPGSDTAYLQRRTEVIRGRMSSAQVP